MAQRESILFSETQALSNRNARILLALPPAAALVAALRQIVWHKPWSAPAMTDGGLVFLAVFLVAVYIRLITVKLVTVLRPREIEVGLRGFWKRRRIPLDQIRAFEPVTYDATRDFGGYGIRSGRGGVAYIALGNRAIEFLLASGGRILIGSQDPEELARRIRQARKQLPPS